MEPETKLLEHAQAHDPERPLVFLDTNVIRGYLRGEPAAAQLFSAEASGRTRFAVNPIVLQELLLACHSLTGGRMTFHAKSRLRAAKRGSMVENNGLGPREESPAHLSVFVVSF